MDLYEALKSGTSSEELLNAFNKELDAAKTRIKEEKATAAKEKEREQTLNTSRYAFAYALNDYAKAILNKDEPFEEDEDLFIDNLEEALIEFEKEMKKTFEISNKLDKIFKTEKTKKSVPANRIYTNAKPELRSTDDEVINAFLNSLK